MQINVVLAVAALSLIAGVLLLLRGIIAWRGVYAVRGVVLAAIGGAMLLANAVPLRWPGCGNDKLRTLVQERREVECSLYGRVLPLVARCEHDIDGIGHGGGEAGTVEREKVLAALEEAQQREREHEVALCELDAAIAALEREQALTEVKDVVHARAAARVALRGSPTNKDEHNSSKSR